MTTSALFKTALADLPLVAILRGLEPAEAAPVGAALVGVGWRLIEVPLNSPQPLQSIETLRAAAPNALVGAGTVLTVAQVREVHAAGGQLVVAPNFDAAVVRAAAELGMVCLPGVATPTEAFAALAAGAHGLKLFPAELVTPSVVKAMRAVLPAETVVLPVGGITPGGMAAYRAAGANGFGLGSALYKPGMAADAVAAAARAFKHAWRGTSEA
jgi:2-dehydro-3-deoxyphosphogalactonate aldolase